MKLEHGIDRIALDGIALIEEKPLQEALASAYQTVTARRAVAAAEATFDRLTRQPWAPGTLARFLNGWRSTHVTALYVSGLMIRLLREAARASGEPSALLYRAAAEVGEIIPEDTGVDDTPHSELYVTFANFLLGSDGWQLNRYSSPTCEEFRSYVKAQRLEADIEDALLTTAASENWNTGEYTYLDGLLRPWLVDVLGRDAKEVEEKGVYVSVHAGKTELGHFLHALTAWQFYCQANGRPADPARARAVLLRYLDGVGQAFTALGQILQPGRSSCRQAS
jgi:hypothetical protein